MQVSYIPWIQIEKSAVSYTPVNQDWKVCGFIYCSIQIEKRGVSHSVGFLIHRWIQRQCHIPPPTLLPPPPSLTHSIWCLNHMSIKLFFWLLLASASMTLQCPSSPSLHQLSGTKRSENPALFSHRLPQRSSSVQTICNGALKPLKSVVIWN